MKPYSTIKYKERISQFIGDYVIDRLEIDGYDVSHLMIQLDIYESLFGPMSGSLLLRDPEGFHYKNPVTGKPILGGENIKITIDKIDYHFIIYKLEGKVSETPASVRYVLHFLSKDGFYDIFKKVSKGYTLTKYEDIITDLMRNHLESKSPIHIHMETETPECVALTYRNILEHCSWLASRAKANIDKYRNANYLWFETWKGWHFIPYEMLLDTEMNVPYSRSGIDTLRTTKNRHVKYDKRTLEDNITFDSLRIIKTFDIAEDTDYGMYGSKLIAIDAITKKEEILTWDYTRDFNKTLHTSTNPGIIFGNNPGYMTYNEQDVIVAIDHSGLFSKELPTKSKTKDWLLSRKSLRQQSEFFKLEGILGANPEIRVGMTLNIDLLRNTPEGLQTGKKDEFYSGRYLIKKLRRTWVAPSNGFITLEMSKDSLEKNYIGNPLI